MRFPRSALAASGLIGRLALALSPGLAGCGGEDEAGSAPPAAACADCPAAGVAPEGCGEGFAHDGARGCTPILPPAPCPAGTMALLGSAQCQPVGVPPDGCGGGFVSDGAGGCDAILPADACPFGTMAVPGETACRPIAPCGAGPWGAAPIEPSTQFVDGSYGGGDSDGTAARPWTTIQEGVDAASAGAVVAVAAGAYAEDVVVLGKAVRIWGRCPALVEVAGSASGWGAIDIEESGTEVHDLAATGELAGITVWAADDVLVERVWLHDAATDGLYADLYGASAGVTVRWSLFEANGRAATSFGAALSLEASVVRGADAAAPDEDAGEGLVAVPAEGERPALLVAGSLVERTAMFGIFASGADVSVDATLVRGQLATAAPQARGISVQEETGKVRSALTMTRSIVEQSPETGVSIYGSDALIEASVVRDMLGQPDGLLGRGISVRSSAETQAPASLTMRASTIERSREAGLVIGDAAGDVETTLVRDNVSQAIDGRYGRGIVVQGISAATSLSLRRSLVERAREIGLFVLGASVAIERCAIRQTGPDAHEEGGTGMHVQAGFARSAVTVASSIFERNLYSGVQLQGADASIDASLVRDTLPQPSDLLFGRGIGAQAGHLTGEPTNLTLSRSVVERNADIGVHVSRSFADIHDTVIRDTAARPLDGSYGDGISAMAGATVELSDAVVAANARVGVATFGSKLVVARVAIECNPIDLDLEPQEGAAADFDDAGENACGCADQVRVCAAASAGLAPPELVPPVD